MITMKTLLALIFSCCLALSAFSQSLSSHNRKALKYYEQANKLLSLNQYREATEELKKAVTEDDRFTEAYALSAEIYRRIQKYEEAKINYRKAHELNPNFEASLYFNLGESELKTGEYLAAQENLKKYSGIATTISPARKQTLSKYFADIEFSLQAIKKPILFEPQNLGSAVNSSADEYLPVVTANERTLIYTRKHNNNEDFYQSFRKGGQWGKSQYLSSNINTQIFNEGSQCISPDGKYLFFTGCNRPDGLGRCDIYVCHREGNEWSKPFNLGKPVNGNTWESQPSISADGSTLYFISNRPGGLGGYDIWKSSLLEDGNWSAAENLGADVNTPYDEESAFIHPDGETLYFSSKGWPGLGGRDLFFSKLDKNGKWQKPVNMGYPLNTFKDEGGLVVSTDGKTAYFSSDKEGGFGMMDIYYFQLAEQNKPALVTYVEGHVFDADNKQPLDAQIKITNTKTSKVNYQDNAAQDGSFLATMPAGHIYALTVEKEGYLLHSENFALTVNTESSKPFQLSIGLKRIKPGASIVLNNIFFDTNQFTLLPDSKTELMELVKFLNNNPKLNIELSGHTDNVGDDNSNLNLSANRAKAVYNFLVSNKIPASRLSFKGYGETKPIASNNTEDGRKQNRRTELLVK
jgi:outer membrane protein OmpA-like peptidoglycan-associated protein/tetratricopeptide (TPR) repeat protein